MNGIDLVVWSVPIKQVLALFLDSASSVELEISFKTLGRARHELLKCEDKIGLQVESC